MKISQYCHNNSYGFALLELLMVFVIIGTLASIAIPHNAEYREKALEAQCQANRYHIEMEELAYYTENNKPSLVINDQYKCPSGGTYVWLIMDPEDPRYPKIGCSIHFTGSAMEICPQVPETGDEIEDISAAQLIDDLMTYLYSLNLSKGVTNSLISYLKNAANALEQGKNDQAIKNLNNFITNVKNQQKKGKISQDEADTLISRAEKIINML